MEPRQGLIALSKVYQLSFNSQILIKQFCTADQLWFIKIAKSSINYAAEILCNNSKFKYRAVIRMLCNQILGKSKPHEMDSVRFVSLTSKNL